ncbi:MAG: hypothetical protein K2J60_00595 [Acetatifactor sp.]|nr:hypothetical protein [Acetatifactor sp.]
MIRGMVMLLCPLVGPLFFVTAQLFYRLFFSAPVSLEDVVFSKERKRTFVHAEEERESNLVPLEEAIEITDTENLRGLMMNVVRGDIQKSLASIMLALNSEDTETAHYAASVLQDALNDFRANVQKQYNLIMEDKPEQLELAEALTDYMDQVLAQHVFTELEQERYVGIMGEVCDLLYNKDRGRMTSARYEAVSLRYLELEDFDNCEKWCERAEYHYPNTLATFSCLLKLYFNSGQKRKFFEVIDELKHSSVVLDHEMLELIRVFQ